jgi:hypothetical protein
MGEQHAGRVQRGVGARRQGWFRQNEAVPASALLVECLGPSLHNPEFLVDNEYYLDREAILRTIRGSDVVAFRFVTVPMRLLVDNRFTETDAPMIKLVPKVDSAEERFKSLKALRPRFKLPPKISAIWWPRYIQSLGESGVWSAMVERIVDAGFPAMSEECNDVLEELRRLERLETINAIGGEGYRTLWPAQRR